MIPSSNLLFELQAHVDVSQAPQTDIFKTGLTVSTPPQTQTLSHIPSLISRKVGVILDFPVMRRL